MKTANFHHAQHTGKPLPEGWDTVGLQEPDPARGIVAPVPARGMATPVNYKDPDYNPELIDKLDPSIMGIKTLEEYIDKFDKELGELKEIQLKGTAKDFTTAKRNRKSEE